MGVRVYQLKKLNIIIDYYYTGMSMSLLSSAALE